MYPSDLRTWYFRSYEDNKKRLGKEKCAVTGLAVGGTMALAGVVPVFAESPASAEEAVITGMTSAASSMTSMVTKAVPIIVPVITAVVVVTFGFKLFKKLTGKA